MIATPEALTEFLETLRGTARIALDTEADSLHCYFEKLCLIQISVPGRDVIVDPLAGFPLEPLYDELARHELIIQGLDYDLRLLRRAGMTQVGRVFDTMIAARLTGIMEFSLAALLESHFGVTLAKGSQKANWARRPLSPKMVEYARNDTHYLEELAVKLETRLAELGRLDWLRQSCEKAIESTKAVRERDIDNLWRINGSGLLRGRAAALLRALWMWRDAEAQLTDRPPFHILRGDQLIEAAQRFDKGEPVEVPHLTPRRNRTFFEAAEAAMALPESEWPKQIRTNKVRFTPAMEKRFDEFKKRRDEAAEKHHLDPSLIASRGVLENMVTDMEGTLEGLLPWQKMLLGFDQ